MVEVARGDRVESRHRGWLTVVAASGKPIASVGAEPAVTFIRSSAKPFQLAPFVASGHFDAYDFPAPTEALAIMAASHTGEDRHARTVQTLLREGGLTREVLACGTHRPYDRETAERLTRDGEPPSPLRHNCSGKHAGMALHAKAAGWPVETYWQPNHPVQQLALDTVAALADVSRTRIELATDGCGVLTFGIPLQGLALAFARLADPTGVKDKALRSALERIRDAMMAHPELVGGERRSLDTSLMRAAPGVLVAKGGAEGVQAVAILGDQPRGLAIKVEDGDATHRARNVATVAALRDLGVLPQDVVEGRLAEFAAPPIEDPRGEPSGAMRAAFSLG